MPETNKNYVETIAENVVLKVLETQRKDFQRDLEKFSDEILRQLSDAECRRRIERQSENDEYERRRNAFFESTTGRSSDDTAEFRKDVDFLANLRKESEQDKRTVRNALINYGVPVGISTLIAWVVVHFSL